ncbi:H-NS histone family protein (plasmid) [Yersinia pseudotuberculosis IP 32953]|uniref:DNA-binding protein n=1 Tax=Yersinia pseudotuberculosis serotype I (strain IP32953) TaxID=273123 RepID=Q663D4_YERPS|nr:H-NS family nucleoid-associated regulatory protein [Yersinia pseudotuberculosis]AJJ53075.1 H-NS histone family protein [Yersinia pseudotuberculosis IP 32953]BET64932.1 hypothetical protein YPSE1_43910 [Yersinia pseudotuberculosis]CAF25462.1 DNA-binding protein [Yersinia pseudotuberculosis IP 32953]CNM03997.1 DNA-binding protein [Yersinia pseudotuberculosis]
MSDNYAEVKRILANIRTIRTFVREVDYLFLVEAHEKLGVALEERKAEFECEQEELNKKEAKKKELLAFIASEGFTLEELNGNGITKRKKPPVHRKPKYTFEENGEMKVWSGVGRKPKPIEVALNEGKTLSDFLICSV